MTRLAIRSTIALAAVGTVALLGYAAVTHPGEIALGVCIGAGLWAAAKVTGLWP